MASPHHRHQSSLEGLINFATGQLPLEAGQRARAEEGFNHIINHFDTPENAPGDSRQYNRPRLVRFTFQFAISEESKDSILQAFFQSMELPIDGDPVDFTDQQAEEKIHSSLIGFADYLLDNFFLPLKASTRKTPQPSPAYHSAIRRIQDEAQEFVGTSARLSALRGSCLIRDRYRCVISRRFDAAEAIKRMQGPSDARDNDGQLLAGEGSFTHMEVAHILPHSLTKVTKGSQLDPSRAVALTILNMFDKNVTHLIDGVEIDRPRNALTLSVDFHMYFGDFQVFFEPVEGAPPHTYRIDTFLPPAFMQGLLPTTRTLFLTENRTIEPPSPRLLAIHRAIAHILHLSAAGHYIDKMFRDMEEQVTRADGSTDLGRLVNLRLNGWWDGTVDVY